MFISVAQHRNLLKGKDLWRGEVVGDRLASRHLFIGRKLRPRALPQARLQVPSSSHCVKTFLPGDHFTLSLLLWI